MKAFVSALIVAGLMATSASIAQVKIAVLPFKNKGGNLEYLQMSYGLSDSLSVMFSEMEMADGYELVPVEEVEFVLADLNLDPNNDQYESDMWKAVEILGVDKVVTGVFNVKYDKVFINAYIYDVETKLPDAKFKAENVYKRMESYLSAVKIIAKRLIKAFA